VFDDHDHDFAIVVLNASLTLMSILVAVITIVAVQIHVDPIFSKPIRTVVIGTTVASVLAGYISFGALIQLRLRRWSTAPLAVAFGGLIFLMPLGIGAKPHSHYSSSSRSSSASFLPSW
jgi:hypothetical protein